MSTWILKLKESMIYWTKCPTLQEAFNLACWNNQLSCLLLWDLSDSLDVTTKYQALDCLSWLSLGTAKSSTSYENSFSHSSGSRINYSIRTGFIKILILFTRCTQKNPSVHEKTFLSLQCGLSFKQALSEYYSLWILLRQTEEIKKIKSTQKLDSRIFWQYSGNLH